MAAEPRIPRHRWFQKARHVKLPRKFVDKSVIREGGIDLIDGGSPPVPPEFDARNPAVFPIGLPQFKIVAYAVIDGGGPPPPPSGIAISYTSLIPGAPGPTLRFEVNGGVNQIPGPSAFYRPVGTSQLGPAVGKLYDRMDQATGVLLATFLLDFPALAPNEWRPPEAEQTAPANTTPAALSLSADENTLTYAAGVWTGNPVPTVTATLRFASGGLPDIPVTPGPIAVQEAWRGIQVSVLETANNIFGDRTQTSNNVNIPAAAMPPGQVTDWELRLGPDPRDNVLFVVNAPPASGGAPTSYQVRTRVPGETWGGWFTMPGGANPPPLSRPAPAGNVGVVEGSVRAVNADGNGPTSPNRQVTLIPATVPVFDARALTAPVGVGFFVTGYTRDDFDLNLIIAYMGTVPGVAAGRLEVGGSGLITIADFPEVLPFELFNARVPYDMAGPAHAILYNVADNTPQALYLLDFPASLVNGEIRPPPVFTYDVLDPADMPAGQGYTVHRYARNTIPLGGQSGFTFTYRTPIADETSIVFANTNGGGTLQQNQNPNAVEALRVTNPLGPRTLDLYSRQNGRFLSRFIMDVPTDLAPGENRPLTLDEQVRNALQGTIGYVMDPKDTSLLFQDTAGTVPVTAPGQLVARVDGKWGIGANAMWSQANSALRPLWAPNRDGLLFDGAGDLFDGDQETDPTEGAPAMFMCAELKFDDFAATRGIIGFSTTSSQTQSRFVVQVDTQGRITMALRRPDGVGFTALLPTPLVPVNQNVVLSCLAEVTGLADARAWVNGVPTALFDLGTPAPFDPGLSQRRRLGSATTNTSTPRMKGRIGRMVVCPFVPTTEQRLAFEQWVVAPFSP